MNCLKHSSLIFLILVSLNGISYSEVTFLKEKEIQLKIDSLGDPILFAMDTTVNIMFQNRGKEIEFQFFDDDFNVIMKKAILRGEGPGEATNPFWYGSDDKRIIIYDASMRRYLVFNRQFKFMHSVSLANLGQYLYSGYHYVSDRGIIIDSFEKFLGPQKSAFDVYLIKLDWQKASVLKKIYTKEISRFDAKKGTMTILRDIHTACLSNFVYILDCDSYRICKFNLNGEKLKEIKRPFKKKVFPVELRKKWLRETYNEKMVSRFDYPEELQRACWIIPLKKCFAVGLRDGYGEQVMNEINVDYFDVDLNYLGQGTMPYFPGWNGSDAQKRADWFVSYIQKTNRLYTLDVTHDEKFVVKQWKVNEALSQKK